MTDNIQNGEGVELLPCPHCGPGMSVVDAIHDLDISQRWQVYCGACGSSSGSTKDRAGCVALWNTRHSLAREPATADVERVLVDFYTSPAYNPKAARPADTVKAAIAFALSRAAPSSEPAIAEGERSEEFQRLSNVLAQQPSEQLGRVRVDCVVIRRADLEWMLKQFPVCDPDAALAQSSTPPASKGVEAIAWSYELAHALNGDGTYSKWRDHLSKHKPQVPEGSIRNLVPLYASPTPSNDTLQGSGEEMRAVIIGDIGAERGRYKEESPTWRAFGFCIAIAEAAALQKDTRHDG